MLHHDVSHSFRRVGTQLGKESRFSWAQSRPLVMYLSYRNRLLLTGHHGTGKPHGWRLAGRMTLPGVVHTVLLLAVGERTRAEAVVHGLIAGLLRPSAPPEIGHYLRENS